MRTPAQVPYRWWIATVLVIAYSVQYLDRVKTNVLMPYIATDIGLSTEDIGTGAFLMAIFGGPAQMFSGWLTDKYGAKRVLLVSVIAWSLMTAWMGMIENKSEFFARMALFGFCIGTEYVPSARILVRWFSRQGRARAQSFLSWAWILTPAWASVLVTQVAFHTGDWRMIFYLTACTGLLPLALISIYVYDRPEQCPCVKPEELRYAYADEISAGHVLADDPAGMQSRLLARHGVPFVAMLRNGKFIAAICVAVVMQIITYSALVWIPVYLSDVFSFRLDQMGIWSSLYFLFGAVGSFISSHLSDSTFRADRRTTILVGLIGLIPFILLLANLESQSSRFLLFAALCGMGFFGSMVWGPLLALPAELFSPEVYGKAMGFMNGTAHTFAAFSAKLFAMLIYSKAGTISYSNGWYFVCCCVGVATVAACFLRTERYSVRSDSVLG